MKQLKIENNQGFYSIDWKNWKTIDQINKEDLLLLLEHAINYTDFDMDKYDSTILTNQAHQIIYENIYKKFQEILGNRTRFKDESVLIYKEAIEKYTT